MDLHASKFTAIYECMTKAGYRYKLQDSKGSIFHQRREVIHF